MHKINVDESLSARAFAILYLSVPYNAVLPSFLEITMYTGKHNPQEVTVKIVKNRVERLRNSK